MDLQIIVVLVLVALCGVYYVITVVNNKKRDAILLQPLIQVAEKNNCHISQHDMWSKSAIGIDEAKGVIFFTREVQGSSVALQIDTAKIKQCRVIDATRSVVKGKDVFRITDRIELLFQLKEGAKSEMVLEFYNSDYDSLTIQRELEIAEKWCLIINKYIV